MDSWVQSWLLRTNLKYRACHEKVRPGHTKRCTQNSSSDAAKCNRATSLRKSAPGHPNISDYHVFCAAVATQHASLQIFFKCPTPATIFGNATKPSRFAHFWHGAQAHAPATRKDIWTSRNGPNMSEHVAPFAIWLGNVLRQTACTFSTSQLPKVVRTCCFLNILPWKRASRQNGVLFFDMSTSKSGPTLRSFVHFDLDMFFAPQQRAPFRHLNFPSLLSCVHVVRNWISKFPSIMCCIEQLRCDLNLI